MKLGGWGNFPVNRTDLCSAFTPAAIASFLAAGPTILARGAGRSYGDAAVGIERTLDLTGLNRFIAFDEDTGILTVEAGVMLKDIITVLLPRGFFPPVVPGTQFVTIGGMIASNVHGKNHHCKGGFGRHTVEIKLALGDGSVVACSRSENEPLFHATIGCMGLTGVIVSASFRMQRVETAFIRQETLVAANIDEMMGHCETSKDWRYTVAWIDGLSTGSKLGRGLVFRGEHARANELAPNCNCFEVRSHSSRSVPVFLPKATLNRFTVKAFNELYYLWGVSNRAEIVDWRHYFFPLDAVLHWNRIYGRQGLIQHQCVIPKSRSREALGMLLERISHKGNPSFLAVLKLLGPDEDGLLSFPMEGFTLAIDFPADQRSLTLANELDEIVTKFGGRIYLAKDARQARSTFESGYPNLRTFRDLRRSTGAGAKFSSYLSERLDL
jgi:decaprenylphospho-beta-D-ribofuranose 2-oxidase